MQVNCRLHQIRWYNSSCKKKQANWSLLLDEHRLYNVNKFSSYLFHLYQPSGLSIERHLNIFVISSWWIIWATQTFIIRQQIIHMVVGDVSGTVKLRGVRKILRCLGVVQILCQHLNWFSSTILLNEKRFSSDFYDLFRPLNWLISDDITFEQTHMAISFVTDRRFVT